MRVHRSVVLLLICMLGLLTPSLRAGLYGDEGKDIKTGDIDSQDYWWTKFDMMMLDLALKQHQPEGRIGVCLASTKDRLASLAKDYPQHEQIKAWKGKVDDVISKIDPNADRGQSFKPGCPWEESNFGQLWVNDHWAKMELDAKNVDNAHGLLQNCEQNLDILLRPDRMKDYPDDLRKWVTDAKPEVDKMLVDSKR